MRRFLAAMAGLALIGAGIFFGLTAPSAMPVPPGSVSLPDAVGDPVKGELVFLAGGCASCHAAPGAKDDAKKVLSGGLELHTEFGTFVAPNISPSPQGIGDWTPDDFVTAMTAGISPDGRHYYPAFPYTSYAHMTGEDLADLWAYMSTLPPSDITSRPHALGFPFTFTRGLGLWKIKNHRAGFVMPATDDPVLARGRYLVEGPGHCAECHTPRDITGGLDTGRWMQGGPNPDGKGRIPDISQSGIGDWSESDVAYYLESGFTPSFDSTGGQMALVVENYAKLPAADRVAVARYLKSLP